MKKVLFLIHTLGGGGAEKVLVNLVNNLNPKKYEITLMTVVDVGELKNKLNKNIKYKTTIKIPHKKNNKKDISGSLLNNPKKYKKILIKIYSILWKYMNTKFFYKIFIKEKYDIEISFLEGISSKVIAASNNKDSKKYAWIHVDLTKQTKSEKVFKNTKEEFNVYNKFDKIICVSNDARDKFIQKFGINPNKVIVKYNPIDKNNIMNLSNEKCEIAINKDAFKIISVGRLNAQKSYDRLIRICKRLIDEGYNIELKIVGEGTHRQLLDEYIKENNLTSRIKLIGFKSNPYKYMKDADLYVCSSVTEGFSTAVSEAIILGLPVITTDCAGMREILGNENEYGIITQNNIDALYYGIKKLLDNKKMLNQYREKAKERAKIFEMNKAIESVEELIDG